MTPLDVAAIGFERAEKEWEEDAELSSFMSFKELVQECVEATFWKSALENRVNIDLDFLDESTKIAHEILETGENDG